MKFLILIVMISGNTRTTREWATFDSRLEAECHKTRLFDYNRKYSHTLRKHGYDIPKDWATYNERVIVKEKEAE